MARICRSGRHVDAARIAYRDRHTKCGDCQREQRALRDVLAPRGVGAWSHPRVDALDLERFAAWSAGLDAAIARARREEGFDGRERTWRTLGDVPGMQAAPVGLPLRRPALERRAS